VVLIFFFCAHLFKEGTNQVAKFVEQIISDTYQAMKEWNYVVFKFEKWPPWFLLHTHEWLLVLFL
jgi:hypothetical protein